MTNAPERIHATASHDGDTGSWNKNPIDERFGLTQIEYVRADVAQAMVAAALGAARMPDEATPDARAALDAMLTKAYEEGAAEGARRATALVEEVVAVAREALELAQSGGDSHAVLTGVASYARCAENIHAALIDRTVEDAQ